MAERIIHTADLSAIRNNLRSLAEGIEDVGDRVNHVDDTIKITRQELSDLQAHFNQFIDTYTRATQVSLAETRLIKLRQELASKFGHYDDVRRAAVGLLQATDISVVHTATMRDITEELMVLTPAYWLAPALVALAAWLRDDQPLAQRALGEALRRDDEKTSLFFALIARRAGRGTACATWLDRFLGQQDPMQLKRQTIVLINATAGGVFAPGVQQICYQRLQAWIDELSDRAGFVEEQRRQWRKALESKIPEEQHGTRYPHLERLCTNWQVLNSQLNRASLNTVFLDHMRDIFESPLPSSARLADAVDDLLTHLTTDHDAAELPMKMEEARLEAIIAQDGRVDIAQKHHDLERESLVEEVSFTQLLTNAAMHAERFGASRASQRLAFALSRGWVHDAFSDLTIETRRNQPDSAQLQIGNWNGQTHDGTEEKALQSGLEQHIQSECMAAVAQIRLGPKHVICSIVGVLLLLTIFMGNFIFALIGAALLAWVFFEYRGLEKKRDMVRDSFDRRRQAETAELGGCLAEYVEWLRDFDARDAVATQTSAYIDAIAPDTHLALREESSRRILTNS
ncbi:hypothetical protein [Komagataeibacter sp. FNDCF1]|uniref:hypothetical protein n=1 Tax=Komagataeibacter sp. FNDCF1 TaxID=2878681 RepID=UPI001E509ACA|nr:hypothetical protein [Komagataeibacter sp. FNDCF1]MCE2563158.1 hypothetical protein [Komagataeibacter sp. FNDCF1]